MGRVGRRGPPSSGPGGLPQPPRLAALRPAAAGGPVVTVNTSPLRCDALILTSGGVTVVPLPALSHTEAEARAAGFAEALRAAEAPAPRPSTAARPRRSFAKPWSGSGAPSRRPSSPTSPPHRPRRHRHHGPRRPAPHLAVRHRPPGPAPTARRRPPRRSGRRTLLLDRAVPSYTPTVAALAAAVRTAARRSRRPRRCVPLVVALPRTPGFAPLDGALTEARAAADRYGPDTVLFTGADARRARVLTALPTSTHVHFACHAVADPTSPYGSHLILQDQPLTVAEISRLRLAHGEFCYLSACATARSGRPPDEAVQLGGAFHLAGFSQVVATLWPVEEPTAAEAARLFHSSSRTTPAHALHETVRTLRANAPLLPSRWAGQVHIGP
ncbi:CHAT domain-containing protein [Streptomyces noursei]|nr:CHAT domain-containing protein [Streptomyces noursei]